MKSISISSVLATSILLLVGSSPVAAQSETYIGCFTSSKPLEDQGSYEYQSNGYCMNLCYNAGYSVFGLFNKDHCLCGDTLPAKSTEEDSDDLCNKGCAAWPIVMCGGANAYSVYLTGLEDNVSYLSSGSSSSSSTTSTSGNSTTTQTNGAVTTSSQDDAVVATATNSAAEVSDDDKKDGPNTAAIAAGVVIGVVGFAALVGAGFFLWRFKKRHPADKRMREMGTVEQFGKPVSQDSMSDSRFDGDFMAQRRQSNGSIDDDRDFSRRILQVTNPDRR
ncbi:WSC-domain-containing protein [Aspergillus cavernicola]|uniref:WSC-domain-containing protein n=1 Tax=Aspergillus cavernicola TaxID=176166 RepID=A0ABR4IMX1_9EURO